MDGVGISDDIVVRLLSWGLVYLAVDRCSV